MCEKVGIVILHYKNWLDTINCYKSVLSSDYFDFEVLIVDNDDNKKDLKQINAMFEEAGSKIDESQIVQTSSNLGFSGGLNIGLNFLLKKQGYQYFWLLNNDTEVLSDSLSQLVQYFNKKKVDCKLGLLGSKLLYWQNRQKIQALGGLYNKITGTVKHVAGGEVDSNAYKQKNLKLDYPVGAALFLSADFLQEVGLLSEDYFLFFEELDWTLRAAKKGYKIDCCLDSIVFHKESESIGFKSKIHDYYSARNVLIFNKKFYPFYLPIVFIYQAFQTILPKLLTFQFIRLKVVFAAYKDFLMGQKGSRKAIF